MSDTATLDRPTTSPAYAAFVEKTDSRVKLALAYLGEESGPVSVEVQKKAGLHPLAERVLAKHFTDKGFSIDDAPNQLTSLSILYALQGNHVGIEAVDGMAALAQHSPEHLEKMLTAIAPGDTHVGIEDMEADVFDTVLAAVKKLPRDTLTITTLDIAGMIGDHPIFKIGALTRMHGHAILVSGIEGILEEGYPQELFNQVFREETILGLTGYRMNREGLAVINATMAGDIAGLGLSDKYSSACAQMDAGFGAFEQGVLLLPEIAVKPSMLAVLDADDLTDEDDEVVNCLVEHNAAMVDTNLRERYRDGCIWALCDQRTADSALGGALCFNRVVMAVANYTVKFMEAQKSAAVRMDKWQDVIV